MAVLTDCFALKLGEYDSQNRVARLQEVTSTGHQTLGL